MAKEKKRFLSKIFGAKKRSCCCNVQIEEVKDDQSKEKNEKNQTQQNTSCCEQCKDDEGGSGTD